MSLSVEALSGTLRDGVLENVRTGDDVNDLNNLGLRGQLLFAPSDAFAVTVASTTHDSVLAATRRCWRAWPQRYARRTGSGRRLRQT